jgi:hypothetical protein
MAKFTIEYNIHVGDMVSFIEHGVTADGRMYDEVQHGIVQDISQLPDVFVEGFCNSDNRYTRWRKDISNLHFHDSKYEDYGKRTNVEIGKDEFVEFIHKGNVGTKEFDSLKYRKL